MTQSIYPCLWFDGQAEEAATLYCSIFTNSAITEKNPIVVRFELDGFRVMGLNGGPKFPINPAISFFVYCTSEEETESIYNALIPEGKAMMPLDTYPWSKKYGWLQDKFGMTWQLSVVDKPGTPFSIKPCFLFTSSQFGRAEEAINFYSFVFPKASTDLLIHYEEGDANAGKVMYSEFQLNNYTLIAMDGPGEHGYTFSEGVSLVVECETQEEIDHYWNKLSEGGREDMCGWLKDKFGVSWQIVPSMLGKLMSDPQKAPRVMQAFLQMRKFEIAKLLKA
ncbi:MAG: VOC family protein [Cyclobacteriaceae bacterium]|nr:VOC family protein [Cyclobacteriaceae bacterium]